MTKTTNYLCHPSSASFTLVRKAEVFLKEYQSHLLRSSCQIILNKIVYDPSEFPVCHSVVPAILKRYVKLRRRVASGGAMPPDFRFCPPPPNFFLAPSTVFFGRKKLVFLGGKNVKICDFGQKKPSDFGEDLFFWRSPAFGRKICDFVQKKPSDFGKNSFFFFGDHLLLVGNFVISAPSCPLLKK